MDITTLCRGATVLLEDGSVGEVVDLAVQAATASVRVLESPFAPDQVGRVRTCTDYDIVAVVEGGTFDSSQP